MEKEKLGAGEIAILVILPVALVAFAIDGVVLLAGDRADREAAAKRAAATVVVPDAAAPSATAGKP